jgi:beta-ribofuranosylaminobenzene 5'-phosphate synthase
MRADIPIGKILKKHAIESRREILKIGVRESDNTISLGLGNRAGPFLFRRYKIIRTEEPLMLIEEFFPATSFTGEHRVIIESPSRLHLGLIDLNGALGRVDGGIGIALDHPRTVIEACRTGSLTVLGGDEESNARTRKQRKQSSPVSGSWRAGRHPYSTARASASGRTALSGWRGQSVAAWSCSVFSGKGIRRVAHQDWNSQRSRRFILDSGYAFGTLGKSRFPPSSISRINPAPVIARHPFPRTADPH